MSRNFLAILSTALAVWAASPVCAQESIQLGVLECDVSAGVGLIFTQKQKISCIYTPNNGGAVDRYSGVIEEFGLELGKTNGGVLTWVVVAAENGVPKGALAGKYVGLSASASAGAGIGANDLSGGLNRSYVLQPYSIETQTGVNIAAGVARVTLQAVP